MAKDKNSFTAYCDWGSVFDELTDDQAGKLVKHLFDYVRDKNPETSDPTTKLLFIQIKATLKRDLKKWEAAREKNRQNGQKGGRPTNPKEPKKPTGFSNNPSEPKKAVRDSVSVSVSDTVSDSKIFIFLDEEKIFDALPIIEYYEVQFNGMQKENHNLSWRAMVPDWIVEHAGEEFSSRDHVKNSFKKYYLNKLKVNDWKSAKKINGANSPKFSGDYSEAL